MDIKSLTYFRTIAQAGSISKAASQLALSQPALSQQLSLLERELDMVLVERIRGGIRLTQPGLKLLEKASELLDSFENLKASLTNSNFIASQLTIAAGGTAAATILPKGLALFSKKYPQIVLHLQEADNEKVKQDLKAGQVDMAVTSYAIPDTSLHCEYLLSDTIIPVVTKKHALAKLQQVKAADILEYGLLLYHPNSVIRQISDTLLRDYSYESSIRMQLRSVQSLVKCVEAGLGVGFISRLSLTGQLKELEIKKLTQKRPFYLCVRQSSQSRLQSTIFELKACLQKVIA